MSSRLAQDRYGRTVAIISVRTLPDVELGYRFVVLGDTIASAGVQITFMAETTRRASRPANSREQREAQRHAPYRPALSRAAREQRVPDDELGEHAAIELARKEQLSYASSGIGTTTHLSMERIKQQAKIDITHVPYQPAQAVGAAVAGHTQISCTPGCRPRCLR
jgi:hypothetical protein